MDLKFEIDVNYSEVCNVKNLNFNRHTAERWMCVSSTWHNTECACLTGIIKYLWHWHPYKRCSLVKRKMLLSGIATWIKYVYGILFWLQALDSTFFFFGFCFTLFKMLQIIGQRERRIYREYFLRFFWCIFTLFYYTISILQFKRCV